MAGSNSIYSPSDGAFVWVNFYDLDGDFQESSSEIGGDLEFIKFSELEEVYASLKEVEIARFTKEKLSEMCTFSKIAYGDDDQKLSQLGYKTQAEFTNEGYKIIPFDYDDTRFYYGDSIRRAGFVFIKGREITIAYRGTKVNYYDIISTDLNAFFTILSFLHDGEMIHRGFCTAFMSSFKSLHFILKKYAQEQKLEIKDFRINLTGHSMGGAIAKIAALCLNKTEGAQDLHVATFGDPRVFDLTASKTYDNILGKNTIRVTQHRKDLVPAIVPGWCGYAHVGKQFRVEASYSFLHKIDSYYTSIRNSKWEDFKSNNSVSYLRSFVRILTVTNSAILGMLYRTFAGLALNNELELILHEKSLILLSQLNADKNVLTITSRSNTTNVVGQELQVNNLLNNYQEDKMPRSNIPISTSKMPNRNNKPSNSNKQDVGSHSNSLSINGKSDTTFMDDQSKESNEDSTVIFNQPLFSDLEMGVGTMAERFKPSVMSSPNAFDDRHEAVVSNVASSSAIVDSADTTQCFIRSHQRPTYIINSQQLYSKQIPVECNNNAIKSSSSSSVTTDTLHSFHCDLPTSLFQSSPLPLSELSENSSLNNNSGKAGFYASTPLRISDDDRPSQKKFVPSSIAIATLALAAVASIAISVYLEMLMVGVAVGACCLVAAAIVYYTSRPASLLGSSDVDPILNNERNYTLK